MSWPISFHDRPANVVRHFDTSGNTVMFSTKDGGRTGQSPLQFFSPSEVPEFEGGAAWFEVERVKNGSRIRRIIRQVVPPAGEAG